MDTESVAITITNPYYYINCKLPYGRVNRVNFSKMQVGYDIMAK